MEYWGAISIHPTIHDSIHPDSNDNKKTLDLIMPFQLKRIYQPADENDGFRVLVDRLWPRGIKKENANKSSKACNKLQT